MSDKNSTTPDASVQGNGKAARPEAFYEKVPFEDITFDRARRRRLDSARITSMAMSIDMIGLLNPITLTTNYELVAGLHRFCAVGILDWETIPAVLIDFDQLQAELAEIDENLQRAPLTALEESQKLKRRKEIYETIHPETKQFIAGAKASNKAQGKGNHANDRMSPASFTEDTAAKTGKSKRSVQRAVKISQDMDESVQETIKDTPTANNKSELARMAKLPPEEQKKAAEEVVRPSSKTKETDADRKRKASMQRKQKFNKIEKTIAEIDRTLFFLMELRGGTGPRFKACMDTLGAFKDAATKYRKQQDK